MPIARCSGCHTLRENLLQDEVSSSTNLVTLGLQEPGLLQGMILLPLGLCADYYTNKQSTYKKDPSQEFQGKRSTVQPDFKKFCPPGCLGFTLQRFIQGLLKRLRSFPGLRQRCPFGLQLAVF